MSKMILSFSLFNCIDKVMSFTEREKIERERENLRMAIGNEFSLGFGMTAEYVNRGLQLRNECAYLDLHKGTGP